MQNSNAMQAAQLLVKARRENRRLADLPAELQPGSIADAYAVQDAAVALQGAVGGWKVAPGSSDAEPRCAPVLSSQLHASPVTLGKETLLIHPEIEVEIAVRFATDLPARPAPYTVDEVARAIGSIHPALEVLSSRFENRKAVPALATVADSQSNGAVVYGPALADWRAVEFGSVAMTLFFDGAKVGSIEGGPSTDAVLGALVWLANHTARRNGGLRAGQVIITGARIKPVVVPKVGTLVRADVAGLGSVTATI